VGIQRSGSGEKSFGEILGLRDEIGKIQAAIADFETGKKLNVAIIAGPLGGKTTLSGEIEKINLNRATKITFSEIVRDKKEISLPDDSKRVVIFDNCHFLYMRKPGGFDIFYEFLDMISSQDRIFVTTWNLYTWKYLNEAFGLGRYFPVQIFIPAFNKEDLRLFILKRYGFQTFHLMIWMKLWLPLNVPWRITEMKLLPAGPPQVMYESHSMSCS